MHDHLYLIIRLAQWTDFTIQAICSKCYKRNPIVAKTRPSELDPDNVSITNSLIVFPSPIFASSFRKASVSTNPDCFPNLLRLLIPNTIAKSLLWYRSVSSLCSPSRSCFATSSCFKIWRRYFLTSIWLPDHQDLGLGSIWQHIQLNPCLVQPGTPCVRNLSRVREQKKHRFILQMSRAPILAVPAIIHLI